MSKSFRCRDVGIVCSFEVTAPTEEGLLELISSHALESHNIVKLPLDLKMRIRQAIRG
jgi:predicted small metal-binding protein